MQDYVRCAVQIEPELVGGELVAGHPVGLEAVLEFRYHLLHASPVAVAIRIYEDGKDELSAAAYEQKQGHIAVFPVIGVEQRELLRAVGVGVRVIGIDDDGMAPSHTRR